MLSIDGLRQDLRYSVRTLRGNAGFTAVAVLILALGIGANTAIFSLVSAVLLKPLPFEAPDRLVLLWENFTGVGGPDRVQPTPAMVVEWKARTRSFDGIAMMIGRTYNLTGDGEPERLAGIRTDTNLFSLLGLRPTLGRTFQSDDEGPQSTPVVVISEELWARRFGADPEIIGRSIVIDGLSRTVIGVVPPDFRYPNPDASIWVPAAYSPAELANRNSFNYEVVARLASGVSIDAAQAELDTLAAALQSESPDTPRQSTFGISYLQEHLSRSSRPMLFVLLAAVGAIMLITCANVANLLLARGAEREKELAIRKALGAPSARVLRQLLTESAALAGAGVVLGGALSVFAFAYLSRLIPRTFPSDAALWLDWRVIGFAIGLTVLTVLLFGAGPALVAARRNFNDALRSGGSANAAPRMARMRSALVVTEITLTVVLLASAGLLLRSYAAVLAVDPGFRADHLLLTGTPLAQSKYEALSDRSEFTRRVLERVRALPGVENAGYVNVAPLAFKGGRAFISIEGAPLPPAAEFARSIVANRAAGEGYLETLGVPLLRGRLFDSRDGPDAAPAVVVNASMARRFWADSDPIGRRIKVGGPQTDSPWLTVIGVVGDVRQMGLDVAPEPEFFVSASQSAFTNPFMWPGQLLVRTRVEPLTLAAAVRHAIREVDADQPVVAMRAMEELLDAELTNRNTQLTLVGSFALLAVLLAAVGLYGVLAYAVTQRTREIGLRMALGAQPGAVVAGVMRGALVLAALGIGLGLAASFGLTRYLASFLYGVSPADPITAAGVAALLIAVTLLASYVPARRAAHVDPMSALRTN